MTNEFVMTELRKLQLLKFFPSDPIAIAALAELVGGWCAAEHTTPDTPEMRCMKLVREALAKFRQWECPEELRDLFTELYPEWRRSFVPPWRQQQIGRQEPVNIGDYRTPQGAEPVQSGTAQRARESAA
jgi:hypothetical protein